MNKLLFFLKRIAVPTLFILVELLALGYYMRSTSFTRARLLTIANGVTGGVNEKFSDVGDYFGLRKENQMLSARIVELEAQLAEWVEDPERVHIATDEFAPYLFGEARVEIGRAHV